MTQETGPIWGVPLIDTLPIDTLPLGDAGWRQAMPSRDDLEDCILKDCDRVAAGYEVLLAHYHKVCEERDRLKQQVRDFVIDSEVRKLETGQ